jgi:hypothetical protein
LFVAFVSDDEDGGGFVAHPGVPVVVVAAANVDDEVVPEVDDKLVPLKFFEKSLNQAL